MLAIKSRKFNMDAVLKLIILLGVSIFFFITIRTGKVQLFVHPRIVPYLNFGIVAMLAISLFILGDVFKPQRKKVNVLSYMFFIIPLIMAFSLPIKDVGSGSMSFGGVKAAGQVSSSGNDASNSDSSDNSSISEGSTGNDPANDNLDNTGSVADNISSANSNQNTDASFTEDNKLQLQGDTVVMDDNNFVKWVQEIYNNPSKYEGKKIKVTGFVFKDKQFKANEFVPARLMMVCCAADLSPIGLLAYYNNASELKQDSWFKFTGRILEGEFKGQKTPVIDIESAEKTEKPHNEYVYPY